MSNMGLKFTAPAGWGSRSQLAATMKELADVQGNRDGIWNNEDQSPGSHGNIFERNPLTSKLAQSFSTGLSTTDEVNALQQFREAKEAQWGQPVTQLPLERLKHGELFATQKAIALERMGRTPAEVTEGFVTAAGKVDGQEIPPRELFYQRFAPSSTPSGKVIVLSPGFQETGRNFYEQIEQLNKEGHDVIVMDHQWAGQSDGQPGRVDSGFGVARDVAAMTAFAQQVVDSEYTDNPDAGVMLYGNSMGAGPGVLGAILMNDNDMIELEGAPMPEGVDAYLQAPFLGSTPSFTNEVLGLASKLPLLNRIQAPSAGVPVLTTDKVGAQKGAQTAVLDDVRAQLRSMSSANEDLERMQTLLQHGLRPQGNISIIHGDNDPLADPSSSIALKELLGDQVDLQIIDSDNHVLQQNPDEQDHALTAIQGLINRQ
tara:strand:- start:8878 stop:10164 length:1287 start_codon:yes stop_codon:yes gene_type:complete